MHEQLGETSLEYQKAFVVSEDHTVTKSCNTFLLIHFFLMPRGHDMFSSRFSTVDICDAPRTSCCITISANWILKKLNKHWNKFQFRRCAV